LPGVEVFYAGNAFTTERSRNGVPGTYLGEDFPKAGKIVEDGVASSARADRGQPVGA
jgi:hypothetical protein